MNFLSSFRISIWITPCTSSLLGDTSTGIKAWTCSSSLLLVCDTPLISCSTTHLDLLRFSGLNYRLKEAGSKTTVVAFIVTSAPCQSYTVEALKGQAVTKSLHDTVAEIQKRVGERLFERCARYNGDHSGDIIDPEELLSAEDKILLKRRAFALRRNTLPPVVTHNMVDDHNDPILNQIRRVQLFNSPSDRVKIIFHPEFLNSSNAILGMDYEEFVRGCHLGVFPSYYEPWGVSGSLSA